MTAEEADRLINAGRSVYLREQGGDDFIDSLVQRVGWCVWTSKGTQLDFRKLDVLMEIVR